MNKKQPMMIVAMLTVTMVGFQNCAKVGVADLAAATSEKVAGDFEEDPIVETQDPAPGTVSEPGSPNPPSNPPVVKDPPKEDPKPPVVSNPPPKLPPIVDEPPKHGGECKDREDRKPPIAQYPNCRPLKQLGLKFHSNEMQTLKCLSNPNEKCVIVCHRPPGNPDNSHNKIVQNEKALRAHIAHGDKLGLCKDSDLANDIVACEDDDQEEHYDNHEDRNKVHSGHGQEVIDYYEPEQES